MYRKLGTRKKDDVKRFKLPCCWHKLKQIKNDVFVGYIF